MHWIITADHINKPTAADDADPAPSWVNRRRWSSALATEYRGGDEAKKAELLAEFKAGMNFEFRLYDDDGELYYSGLCKDLDDQDGDSAFGPLDWAANDAGCTRMDYRKIGEGKWETL